MHLVLRARWAYGAWSFRADPFRRMIDKILHKHAVRTGVELLGVGNAGNHLHLRVQIHSRKKYRDFIRSISGEIALKIKKSREEFYQQKEEAFWERRPFSCIVAGSRYVARLADYIKINELERGGISRANARLMVRKWSVVERAINPHYTKAAPS